MAGELRHSPSPSPDCSTCCCTKWEPHDICGGLKERAYLVGSLVDDRAEGDFAWSLCNFMERALGRSGRDTTVTSVAAGTFDAAALARKAVADRADAVVFSGNQERAGAFAAALRGAG
ncbi:hypothetical protein, partial [Streptomyces scabiei]